MKTFRKENLGYYDLEDLQKAASWHKKKYADQPNLTYMYWSDEACVYTFKGTVKELNAIDRFLTIYRKLRRLLRIN